MTADTCAQCGKYADSLMLSAYCFEKDEEVDAGGWCEEFVHHSRRFSMETGEELGPVNKAPQGEQK
jgi:hypothetical protein